MDAAAYSLVGTFDDMPAAQKAVTALGIAGIDGDSISLGGPAADEAQRTLATDEADLRVLMHILKYIIVGAVIGTFVGVALSPLAGWIVVSLIGHDVTTKALLVSLFLSTLMSHMVGGFVGYTLAMQAGRSWELSFQSIDQGEVQVKVRASQPQMIDRAERILRRQRATDIRRIDRALRI
jgi:hypothetical protein